MPPASLPARPTGAWWATTPRTTTPTPLGRTVVRRGAHPARKTSEATTVDTRPRTTWPVYHYMQLTCTCAIINRRAPTTYEKRHPTSRGHNAQHSNSATQQLSNSVTQQLSNSVTQLHSNSATQLCNSAAQQHSNSETQQHSNSATQQHATARGMHHTHHTHTQAHQHPHCGACAGSAHCTPRTLPADAARTFALSARSAVRGRERSLSPPSIPQPWPAAGRLSATSLPSATTSASMPATVKQGTAHDTCEGRGSRRDNKGAHVYCSSSVLL